MTSTVLASRREAAVNEDPFLDAFLGGVAPGELRVALRGVLRHAFATAAGDTPDDMLTALELWARGELRKAAP